MPHGGDPDTPIALDAATDVAARRLQAFLRGEDTDADLAEAIASRNAPAAGQRLGDYTVVEELGAGGMGTVLLAERGDGAFTRRVAIKLIRGFPTEDGLRRLRQERQILAELDHPAIARLLDGGETADGQPFLVMELVEGEGLLAHVARAGLDRDARVALWRQVAEAVAHAHQRLVIHRDIKPANVLVRADGQPKLLDFGVAKLLDVSDESKETSTRIYTPGYAAPEQLRGGAITTRTDVHGLGTLLRELLTGKKGDDRASEPAVAPVGVDRDLTAVLDKARAEVAEERYPTVDALLEDVARWADGLPVRARASAVYRARKLAWRLRVPLALALAAMVATGAFVVQLEASRSRAVAAEAQARSAQAAAERDARRTKEVLDFITATFEAAGPDVSGGRSLTVRELLAAAEAKVGTAPPEDTPALLALLADIHGQLGDPRKGLELIRTATTAMGEVRDDAQGRWLADVHALAAVQLANAGLLDQSMAAARRAQVLQREYGPDDSNLARAVSAALGGTLYSIGEFDAAEAELAPIASATVGVDGVTLDQLIQANHMLSAVQVGRRDGEASLAAARRLRKILSQLPPDHVMQSKGLHQEAQALLLLGRLDEAIQRFQEAITVQEPAVGGRGTWLGVLYNDLASAANEAGRFHLAASAMERSAALLADRGDSPAEGVTLNNLASILESDGQYARAEALFRQAMSIEAPTSEAQSILRSNHGRTLALLGRFDEARREITASRPPRGSGQASFLWLRDTLRLAQLEVWAGRPAAALPYLDQLDAEVGERAELAPVRRISERTRALAALGRGHPAEAAASLRPLVATFAEAYGEASFDADIVRVDLARALAAAGEEDEARSLVQAILPRLEAAVGPEEYNLVNAKRLAAALALRPRVAQHVGGNR